MGVQLRNLFDGLGRAARLSAIAVLATLAVVTLMLALRTESQAGAEAVSVGLVTDGPTVNDGGFNWMSYQGLLRAQSELGVDTRVYTSTDSSQYRPNLHQCADDGNDLCVAIGYGMAEATWNEAQANDQSLFAIVDMDWDEQYPSNLRGITFAADEAAYLAGTLAGLMTESNTLGVIGGFDFPPVNMLVHPYSYGAACANLQATTRISYTNSFFDEKLGAEMAQGMMAQGADVIFAPAGYCGYAAVLTATQSGVWGIGTDNDYYETVFEEGAVAGSEKLLTSVMKRVDNAVFDTINDVYEAQFTSGNHLYDLSNGGVGLAPFHEATSYISPAVEAQLAAVRQGIINGDIDVNTPCERHNTYLPLVLRQ